MNDQAARRTVPGFLLTPTEAAGILRISPRTLQRWRWAGGGPPYHRIGGLCRYSLADLKAWMSTRRRPARPTDQGVHW